GANLRPRVEGFDRAETIVSFVEGAPAFGSRRAPAWDGVRYVDLFPGVDLELTGQADRLTQRFIVRDADAGPEALRSTRLRVDGADGLSLEAAATLRLDTATGPFRLDLAELTGSGTETAAVDAAPAVVGKEEVARPWRGAGRPPATAAPAGAAELVFATYLARGRDDAARGLALDGSGNVYITGYTYSPDFPATTGAFRQTLAGSADAFVAKLSADGRRLIYLTFLGGTDNDYGADIAVDSAGQAVMTGRTRSVDFPVTSGVLQPRRGGEESFTTDAFVARLNPEGTGLVYSTYLGGSGEDLGLAIALDESGHAYVAGQTASADFPATADAFQTARPGFVDGYVVKVSPAGDRAIYATYLGGGYWEEVSAIAVDAAGAAYVAGITVSADLPVTACAWQSGPAGYADSFAGKLTPTGGELEYLSYLGGHHNDLALDLAIDGSGAAYIAGQTVSADFPITPEAYRRTLAGSHDVFLTKVAPQGRALTFSTFLGGSGDDRAESVAIDPIGNAYLTGSTVSGDFPTTVRAIQAGKFPGTDVFASVIGSGGSRLLYSTYLGGEGDEVGTALALDSGGDLYLTGQTGSRRFPTTSGAYQPDVAAVPYPIDAFAARLWTGLDIPATRAMVTPIAAHRVYLPTVRRNPAPSC
ncbi:MAG TPA: SBBP repeat-containing protein, partial [Dehalococcoidia bacterium]|nr:SBBP repeat-containing protein [Dehalococcoidia bacterium]